MANVLETLLLGSAEGMGGGGVSEDATIHVFEIEVGVRNEFDSEVGVLAVFEVTM